MFWFHLRVFIVLTCLFVVLIVGGVAVTPKSHEVEDFSVAFDDCVRVCLLGIQPGATTIREAMLQLQHHLWVGDIRQNAPGNGYAQIIWDWSGEQPNSIDDSRQGRITFYWDDEDTSGLTLLDSLVETVSVYTRIRMFMLQEWLGESHLGNINKRLDDTMGYTVIYDAPGGMISLVSDMMCPVSIVSYWNAQARITVSVGRSDSSYISPSEMITVC